MAYYMVQFAYTSEAWATQTRNPQSPLDRARPLIEGLGGKIHSAFYTFGEYDVVVIGEFPDNVKAASAVVAVLAGGAVKGSKTTPLMTIDEGLEVMKNAEGAVYRPPGG